MRKTLTRLLKPMRRLFRATDVSLTANSYSGRTIHIDETAGHSVIITIGDGRHGNPLRPERVKR